nr:hypothetical protein CFP56_65301 [Quercus suber]
MGSTSLLLMQIYSDAVQRLQEYQMAQDTPLFQQPVAHLAHWLPPQPSQYKANCDGATFQDTNSAGLGVVVCDSGGWVIAALSK